MFFGHQIGMSRPNLVHQGHFQALGSVLIHKTKLFLDSFGFFVALIVTAPNGLHPMPKFNAVLGIIVNLLRSIPFLILLFLIMPMTQFITGSSFGANATIVPLIVSASPFVARMVETSFKEIDFGGSGLDSVTDSANEATEAVKELKKRYSWY